MVDSGCVRVVPLEVGLGRLRRNEVLTVLHRLHWGLVVHARLRTVLLAQSDLGVQTIVRVLDTTGVVWTAAGPVETVFASDTQRGVISAGVTATPLREVCTDTRTSDRQIR